MSIASSHPQSRQVVGVLALAFGASTVASACGDDPMLATPFTPVVTPVVTPPVVDASVVDVAPPPDVVPEVDAAPVFSMKTWRPSGKGLWIWKFDITGMTPAEVATLAQKHGVGYVLIKSGQDTAFWAERFNETIVSEFTSRGLRVLAWPYITPAGGAPAVDAAVAAAQVKGCDGLVLDVEIEWEKGDATANAAAAKTLCDGIRAKVPGVWLGYTSFGWVGYHTKFPWAAFEAGCGDSFFPQVYFSDRGISWDKGLQEARDMIQAAGFKSPIWPVASNDDIAGTSIGPSTLVLNAFFNQAGPYTSLWVLPQSDEHDKRAQLANLEWANP